MTTLRPLTVKLPEFARMSDDEVQSHILARHRDGRWSLQTRQLLIQFNTVKLELNEAWAETWTEWTCPACKRHKTEIARLTDPGVLLCQLDWHHDHLRDHACAIMRDRLATALPENLLALRKRTIGIATQIIERFDDALICNDCNAADGAMKAQLGPEVPSWFSFSPSEIAKFILPGPNVSHALNLDIGAKLWEAVKEDCEDRLGFATLLGARIAAGKHDVERGPWVARHSYDPALFYKLGTEAATAHNRIDGLSETLLARSRSTAGRWSAVKNKTTLKVQAPTEEEFAHLDTERTKSSKWWRESGDDWSCPGCDRSKFEIVRRSNKGSWLAAIQVASNFTTETDPARLARRAVHHDGQIVLGSDRQIGLCHDCRQILSDALTIRPGVEPDCISLTQIRALAAPGAPHKRHAVTAEDIAATIDANAEWIAALTDYRCHQRQALDIGLEHYRVMCSTGLSAEAARDIAIPKLVAANKLPAADAAGWFDWWMSEDARLRALNGNQGET